MQHTTLEELDINLGGVRYQPILTLWVTLPETNNEFTPENRPGPKRKRSSSNHPFSGDMLVSGMVPFTTQTAESLLHQYSTSIKKCHVPSNGVASWAVEAKAGSANQSRMNFPYHASPGRVAQWEISDLNRGERWSLNREPWTWTVV